jgi:hypothetical protein
MTKKHFIALADAIRVHQEKQYRNGVIEQAPYLIDTLADFCAGQNPRFNRDRWIGYIQGTNGKNGGKVK